MTTQLSNVMSDLKLHKSSEQQIILLKVIRLIKYCDMPSS